MVLVNRPSHLTRRAHTQQHHLTVTLPRSSFTMSLCTWWVQLIQGGVIRIRGPRPTSCNTRMVIQFQPRLSMERMLLCQVPQLQNTLLDQHMVHNIPTRQPHTTTTTTPPPNQALQNRRTRNTRFLRTFRHWMKMGLQPRSSTVVVMAQPCPLHSTNSNAIITVSSQCTVCQLRCLK